MTNSVTIATSDPTQPLLALRVLGNVTAATGDNAGGTVQYPLDALVSVPGSHSQGEWYEYTHMLGPDPQTLHPVKVYSQNYATLFGVGKYATEFGQGTASYELFGTGKDRHNAGGGQLDTQRRWRGIVNSGRRFRPSRALRTPSGWRTTGDEIIRQVQVTGTGCRELTTLPTISSKSGNTLGLEGHSPMPTSKTLVARAQVLRVPHYYDCEWRDITTGEWDGTTGGICAVFRAYEALSATIDVSARGFQGWVRQRLA